MEPGHLVNLLFHIGTGAVGMLIGLTILITERALECTGGSAGGLRRWPCWFR